MIFVAVRQDGDYLGQPESRLREEIRDWLFLRRIAEIKIWDVGLPLVSLTLFMTVSNQPYPTCILHPSKGDLVRILAWYSIYVNKNNRLTSPYLTLSSAVTCSVLRLYLFGPSHVVIRAVPSNASTRLDSKSESINCLLSYSHKTRCISYK